MATLCFSLLIFYFILLDQKRSRHCESGFLLGVGKLFMTRSWPNGFRNWMQSLQRQGVLMAVFNNMSPWQRSLTQSVLLVITLQVPPHVVPNLPNPIFYPTLLWPMASFPIYNLASTFLLLLLFMVFAFENMNELCIQFKRLEQNKVHWKKYEGINKDKMLKNNESQNKMPAKMIEKPSTLSSLIMKKCRANIY